MDGIRIVHISDLHISEHLTRGADKHFKAPHRYGHDVKSFLALDAFLKDSEWDLLIITGDISRIGNTQSFEYARNWLESEIHIGSACVGLNLTKKENQEYVIIPGNHDRFNGKLVQGSLDNYHHEFPVVRSGSSTSFYFRGERINIHFYDSTEDNGTFAYGYIDESCLIPKESDGNLNIAMLHHHFVQPPKHKREVSTELINSADISAYFLNSDFDGVFFGHTHQSYIGNPSVNALSGLISDKKRINRLFKRIIPKYFLRKMDNDCLVSYKRVSAKNGQLPTLDSYFNYLYLLKNGVKIKGPSEFNKIKKFYEHIYSKMESNSLSKKLKKLKEKQMLISLAPSACQSEAKWKGLHILHFKKDDKECYVASWNRYQYDGAKFVKKNPNHHIS